MPDVVLPAGRSGWPPAALAASVALVLVVVVLAPEAAPLVPVLLVLLVAGGALVVWGASATLERTAGAPRAAALVLVSVLSLAALGGDDGVDPFEIAFGIVLLLYPVAWYTLSAVEGYRFIRRAPDVVLAGFFVHALIVGVGLALLGDGLNSEFRSDVTTVLAFSLFFPAREVVARQDNGPRLVAGLLLMLSIAAAASSAYRLAQTFSNATAYYEIVDVRVASGEIQIIAGLLVALSAVTAARSRAARLGLLATAGVLLGGLVLAKSRGPWVVAAGGLVLAGLLLPAKGRWRLLGYGGAGAVLLFGSAVLFFGEQLVLVGVGLLRRLTSISSAFTQDVSLLNRYEETAEAWREVRQSPVLGHGWGAQIYRNDLIVNGSFSWGFVHNGYVWLWHKVGAVGLVLFAIPFVSVPLYAVRATRSARLSDEHRAYAAATVGAIAAFAVLGLPSNPFAVLDQMVVVTLTMALGAGLYERAFPS